ncbi:MULTISPECIES: OFA family MFS transporter [Arthrobacter]|uniref:OFA family MFS transporter n=1 Tax=Arthrobacter sunyaminii TaxID=2816859 RepID=A0A975PFD6_9MICC|nr:MULTISPECIES: OFA family MFS transporter [Arthrobacter]MBO0908462.1 OFA family MFS transporter [Arthrobacter sunyaminii]QWQ35989.1 OFA family MFS transporter [Arthrobacter sunyaminii]
MSWLDRENTIAPPGFNRWLIPPAALAVHLCIGQVYATSVYKNALVEHFDASLTQIGIIFSVAIVMLGLSAAVMGTWVDRNGPRKAMFVSAVFWTGGFLVGALGIFTNQLWLLYIGYGVIGGIGLGIGYISPVSTLIKWFPDRPGLATGMAIMGFGGGALIASPLSSALLTFYDPDFGTAGANAGDAVGKLFLTLAAIYLVYMLYGALTIRVPADGWAPEGFDPKTVASKALVTTNHVSAANAIKTRQFWLVWIVLFCNVTAGIGILEQAAPMIQDFFRQPDGVSLVSAAVAGGFVGLLSIGNMGGRFVWSATSDVIGRKRIYMVYLGAGAVLYLMLALFGNTSTILYVLLAFVILSFYGGGFATVPAYLRDLFGTFQVGAIHGRLLTAWSAAGIAGPLIVNSFLDAQGTPGELNAEAYQPALLTMVALLVIGFIANLMVRPVDSKHHEPDKHQKARGADSGGNAGKPDTTKLEEDHK